jgi:protein CpxP
MIKRPDRAEWEKLSAPERMEKQLALMKEREARMADRLAATKAFYAQLTPEQQKIFNENFMTGRRHGKR